MNYPQQTPKELGEVRDVTNEAIAESFENAQDPWKEYALHCVSVIAKKMQYFTVNDVRPLVAASPYKTQDNRALGAVIKHAQKRNWIKPSGDTRVNKTGHGTHMQVWESNIYGEEITFVKPTVKVENNTKARYEEKCPHGLPLFVSCPNCQT